LSRYDEGELAAQEDAGFSAVKTRLLALTTWRSRCELTRNPRHRLIFADGRQVSIESRLLKPNQSSPSSFTLRHESTA